MSMLLSQAKWCALEQRSDSDCLLRHAGLVHTLLAQTA